MGGSDSALMSASVSIGLPGTADPWWAGKVRTVAMQSCPTLQPQGT